MSGIDFTPDTNIYRDRQYLRESHTPSTIVGRDAVLGEYQNALSPVINDEEPNNIFCYGKTGVGKTAVTEYILEELETQASQYEIDLTVKFLNCEGLNTSYQVAVNLVNEFRSFDNKMSTSGHTERKVYEALFDELDNTGGIVLLVLDELDSVDYDKLGSLFYQLPRARSNGHIEDARVGIIGISSDMTLRDNLPTDVKSSLCEKTIKFSSYGAGELEKVLRQRAEKAFYDDAVGSAVISKCSALGAKDGGDARRAIELLREAGDLARQESMEAVTTSHVDTVREKLREDMLLSSISSLQENEKIALYALATLTAEGNERPRSRVLYERYEELTQPSPHDAVTNRRVRDYLDGFNKMNLTDAQSFNGGSKGNHRKHVLNPDVDDVLEELEDTIKMCGVHPSVSDVSSIQYLTE